MKKYNLSSIMKRAWELVKKAGLCISEGLKLAWKEAKLMGETMEEKLIRLGYKVWEKGDMKRIYINDFQKYLEVEEPIRQQQWDVEESLMASAQMNIKALRSVKH